MKVTKEPGKDEILVQMIKYGGKRLRKKISL